jgi:hypothetical protein
MLTDQSSVRRAVYRLTNLSDDDSAMIEHDQSSLEGINLAVEDGLRDSQEWLLRAHYPDHWLVVGTPVTVQGSDTDAAGRYVELEDDFLRLFGDENASAFYVPTRAGLATNRFWGRQLNGPREGRQFRGDGYWVEGDRIRLTRSARPLNGLVYDYIRQTTPPADGTPIDFPDYERSLVAAFAAVHAMENNFLPAGPEMETKIDRNLTRRKSQAWKRARRTTGPRKIRPPVPSSARWFLPYD